MRYLLTLAAICLTAPAMAQQPQACAKRDQVVAKLGDKFGETIKSIGLSKSGVVEVYSAENGSWTILMTRPDGVSCMVASGQFWGPAPPVALGEPT
jgi:hypothetical protein